MAIDLLVVHAPSGAGHKSAATAIADEARSRGLTVATLELFEDSSRALSSAYTGFHKTGRARLARLYSRAMRFTNAGTPGYGTLRKLVARGLFNKFSSRVRDLAPRAIVATHHLPLAVLSAERARGKVDAPLLGVVTDHHAEAVWADHGVDAFVVPGSEALFGLLRLGIDAHRVTVVGMPVDRAFHAVPELAERRFVEPRRVLVMASAFSGDERRALLRSFSRIVNVRVDIVCGLDESDQRDAQEELDRTLIRGHALGFIPSLAAELEHTDVVVGHAGGATVHEAMAAGRPVITVNATTSEELANERFALRSEAGRAASADEVGRIFEELVAGDALERMGANGRRATLAHAARSVVEQALTLGGNARRRVAA